MKLFALFLMIQLGILAPAFCQFEEKEKRSAELSTYALKNNIQMDVPGGFGLTEISPDHFISPGLSWRFPY